jgi:hypothetical protein
MLFQPALLEASVEYTFLFELGLLRIHRLISLALVLTV